MELPKINGEIDFDMVADLIVTKILAECAEIYGTRIDNKRAKDLKQGTKKIIESIPLNELSKEQRVILLAGLQSLKSNLNSAKYHIIPGAHKTKFTLEDLNHLELKINKLI